MSARVCIDDAGFARLRATLARTRDAHEVVHEAGGTAWAPVDPERPFDWDAPSPLSGVKHFFLPDGEVLLRWRGDAVTEEIPDVAPFALVGVRPCDAVAIDYMDRFLAADPCHAARRSRALVVATSCGGACAHGFCLAVDAGPFVTRGFDLGLTRLGHDAIVVDVETEAGAAALAAARVAARPPTPTHLDRLAGARSAARASFAPDPALARGLARLAEESGTRPVAAEEWRRLGPFCFACTGCTTLCPTCSCFTIEDQTCEGGGVRRRLLDSCLLEGFQREASGYNPSPRPEDRVRRFWTHKLGASFTRRMGRPGCTGCGRCDVACPGSIGARAVLSRLGALT